jgi:hypothetical protein
MRIANESFESAAELRDLVTTIPRNINFNEEMKGSLNLENACHCSIQNPLFFSLLSKYKPGAEI